MHFADQPGRGGNKGPRARSSRSTASIMVRRGSARSDQLIKGSTSSQHLRMASVVNALGLEVRNLVLPALFDGCQRPCRTYRMCLKSASVKPRPISLQGVQLQAGSGTAPADEALAGKFVALYFSAHWSVVVVILGASLSKLLVHSNMCSRVWPLMPMSAARSGAHLPMSSSGAPHAAASPQSWQKYTSDCGSRAKSSRWFLCRQTAANRNSRCDRMAGLAGRWEAFIHGPPLC